MFDWVRRVFFILVRYVFVWRWWDFGIIDDDGVLIDVILVEFVIKLLLLLLFKLLILILLLPLLFPTSTLITITPIKPNSTRIISSPTLSYLLPISTNKSINLSNTLCYYTITNPTFFLIINLTISKEG